ncbi:putative oxidoreductase YurR [Sporosarcina sp. NCCP-2222]|uniref:NAD(P)/FAD-dependent oxidoreductase n=1 Tax=Sporosarcina sp. NCCP-2222 TaxID=2935073 RepID=UPI00208CAFD0|nr:FAD-dependent oxidoreductase [Sporosarcina sp. NCCP-2222]GKV55492.1 putative oxidoreductase YurR [Sporosarcina sp. NCCP-2222]
MNQIVIIGGGILGASAAYHLSGRGRDVMLIDRKDSGQATNASAGIICPWLSQRRNKAWYQLAQAGAAYYEELIPMLESKGLETGYSKVGAISIHTDSEKLTKMEERARQRREEAPEIGDLRQLDENETVSLFPYLSNRYTSLYVSGAARVDGRMLRDALLKGAELKGLRIINGSASLQKDAEGNVEVWFDNDRIEAKQVIITAGCWAGELTRQIGIPIEVRGQKAQIAHMKAADNGTAAWPVVMPPNDQYMLAFPNGKIVAGATHEDEHDMNDKPTLGGIQEVLNKALDIAPALSDAEYIETRVGFRPFTAGFLPVIGKLPDVSNVLFANGLGASGLTVGPYLGKQLALMALEEEVEIDVSKYPVESTLH